MNSVLESDYVEPTRPYSQDELSFNREKLRKFFRLSNSRVSHQRCRHFYLVRTNGRKEREMIETNSSDVGNCSVCWRINKTPPYLKDRAIDLVHKYCEFFDEDPTILTYRLNDIEDVFYKWLYEDNRSNHRTRRDYSPSHEDEV